MENKHPKETPEKKESAFDKLSDKHKAFVMAYLTHRIASKAYIETYPDTGAEAGRRSGSRLLTKADVQAAIQDKLTEIWEDRAREAGKVFDELKALGFSDIADVTDEDGNIVNLHHIDSRAVKSIRVEKTETRKDEDVEVETKVIRIDLHDKRSALSELADILKMKQNKTQIGIQIVYADRTDENL